MNKCELCMFPARTYCESDQASLCWDCDAKVHRANFLVARHSRCLLCHACQSLTPWTTSGCKVGRAVSVCESCMDRPSNSQEVGDGQEQEIESANESKSGGGGDSRGDDDLDGENQVMPWSSTTPPPPPSPSSTDASHPSGEESIDSIDDFPLKRYRYCSANVSSFQGDMDRTVSQPGRDDDEDDGGKEGSTVDYCCSRRLKKRRTEPDQAF